MFGLFTNLGIVRSWLVGPVADQEKRDSLDWSRDLIEPRKDLCFQTLEKRKNLFLSVAQNLIF